MRVWLVIALAACDGGNTTGDDAPPGTGDAPKGVADAPANATPIQFCVSETNRYRAMNGKPALAESPQLEAYAGMGAMIDFSTSPHHHFSSTNGGGISFAENECPVQGNWMLPPGGDMKMLVGMCIAAFYSEGPGGGHYTNMMGPYGSLGCGIYQMGTGVTIVQDYGN